jgi:hypothetical protein
LYLGICFLFIYYYRFMDSALFDFIISPPSAWWLIALKVIFLSVSIIFAGFIVYAFFVTKWFRFIFWYNFIEFFTLKIYGGVTAARKWKKIKHKAEKIHEEHYHAIVIQAHRVMDKLLERLVPVYQADNFSTRLAYIGDGTFSKIAGIWESHELYKRIIRRETFIISKKELDEVISAYDQAFKDLDII